MAVTVVDYPERAVTAANSTLLEVICILGEYRENIILVGGLVPRHLIPNAEEPHVGSVDIDLALNHRELQEAGYRTILQLPNQHGYTQDDRQPFIFRREIEVDGEPVLVQLDLLSGEYGGTGKSHRTQKIQDIRPRKARGADLVFENFVEVEITGQLPGGGKDRALIRIASIVPFIVMKATALRDRLKEKDAYDIYYCVRYYREDPAELVGEFKPYIGNDLVQEALEILSEKFASPEHVGPVDVANFLGIELPEEREQTQRDAYERVNSLVNILQS